MLSSAVCCVSDRSTAAGLEVADTVIMAIANSLRSKATVVVLLLIGLWFALAQYNNGCSLLRKESFHDGESLSKVSTRKKYADVEYNTEQQASIELSNLLKEAMKHGQVGSPTVHLVEVMDSMAQPFLMFVCSNCFCDICDKVRLLGYWSLVESRIFHHVLKSMGAETARRSC